jgi:hypothetical protein
MASSFRIYQAISGRFTQSILAIAVAQLPPPITANFGYSVICVFILAPIVAASPDLEKQGFSRSFCLSGI